MHCTNLGRYEKGPILSVIVSTDAPEKVITDRTPDLGNRRRALVAWIVALVMVGVIVFVNQSEHLSAPVKPIDPAKIHAPQTSEPFLLMSKLMVRMNHQVKLSGGQQTTTDMLVKQIDKAATTRLQRLRSSLVVAELVNAQEGLKRLDSLKNDAELQRQVLKGDAAAVNLDIQRELFTRVLNAPPPVEDSLTIQEREEFTLAHGWFYKLAKTRGLRDSDPDRELVVSGGGGILLGTVFAIVVGVIAVLGALIGFVTMIVLLVLGKIKCKFVRPLPGGSVYVEVFALFVSGFLLLSVVLPLLIEKAGLSAYYSTELKLLLQWLLLLACLWPLIRGVTFTQLREQMGWIARGPMEERSRGGLEGVLREVGFGLLAYFSMLPVLAVVLLFTVLMGVGSGPSGGSGGVEEQTLPTNPVIDILLQSSPLQVLLFFILAACWAPIAEEAVFRGALYRHMRGSCGVALSAIVTTVLFGVMHGYHLLMLGPVITLGAGFALMREARGSLIAPMTAHMLHNSTLVMLMIFFIPALRD